MKEDLKNLKINPSDIKHRVNDVLNADLRERKRYMKHKIFKTALTAAAITALLATSAFAMSPAGQEAINSIITYFQNENATEMTSLEELAKYNEEIGKSCVKDGITLTLDNVAADDNFIHIFYTVKSDSEPFFEGDVPQDTTLYSDAMKTSMDTQCVINGALAGFDTNHNTRDGYFVDNYTYKAAEKYNIASMEIPDSFKVELFAERNSYNEKQCSAAFNKLYLNKYSEITDEEKAEIWYLSADIDKSKIKVESVTKEINTRLPWSGVNVEKAVFSPFGSQIVVSTEANSDPDNAVRSDCMAIFDENGKAIDMLNTDLRGNADGSSRNALEILKADKDTKQLKFVPLKYNEHSNCDQTNYKVGQYPIICRMSDYGSVVVTDIRISDGKIEIDYYKDGYVLYDPGFLLLDDNGNNAEPGGKLGCILYTDVHYDTNSYTARYVYDKLDDNGHHIPADESVSAESLKENFTTLGMVNQNYIELDFDNAVTVDLK